MMHVAMADSVKSVQGRYTRFAATVPMAPRASAEAAASAAARHMLVQLYPAQKAKIDEAYALSLKSIPDGAARSDGIVLGERIAAALYAERSNDATDVPDNYRPVTPPGVWIPTTPPLFPQYATAKPWGLTSADQFRPGPPPQLSSALYARDYNETKDFGAAKSTVRTEAQTQAVRFWTPSNTINSWFQVARQLSVARELGLAENARLYALLTMGLANCYIIDWDAKFHYNSWRPLTAIRNGDMDGNDATERDASWTPLLATPMHPEYPSQNSINVGTAVGVLESVFGAGPASFAIADTADARLQRPFTSVAQMGEEQRSARVWAGIHFRNSVEVSNAMGRRIAEHLLRGYLKPTTQQSADELFMPRPQIERLAADLAGELSRLCPPAQPGDQAAFDRCRQSLFQDSLLKRSLMSYTLWGRPHKDAGTRLKDTTLTQFAPDVLAGLYLPLFMFNGRHTLEYDAREGLFLVRLETAFRNRLAPGQFPYPFWHDEAKWGTYQGANSILLWVDPKTARIKIAQFTDRGATPPIVGAEPIRQPQFDGKWLWTDTAGRTQPQVTLFDGLFRADNPLLPKLDAAYRSLALRMRDAQCDSCHVPNNPDGMKRIVLLQTPAHAAGEIQRLMKAVREDRMPRDEVGIEQPLDKKLKSALLESGGTFEALLQSAKDWEAKRREQ
jgi:hypothetical protein